MKRRYLHYLYVLIGCTIFVAACGDTDSDGVTRPDDDGTSIVNVQVDAHTVVTCIKLYPTGLSCDWQNPHRDVE